VHFEEKVARPFAVKTTDDKGSFEGLGAVFNDVHPTSSWALSPEWKDRILPGAFDRTISEHAKAGTLPAMLYMHERGNVVGAWRDIKEGGGGLQVKGVVAEGAKAPSGETLYNLMKMGALNAMSIGFSVRKHALDQEKKIREIQDLDLSEISIVDVPGIQRARMTDVKSLRDPTYLERVLRDAGLSRKEAKALLADGFSALRDVAADDGSVLRDAGSNDEDGTNEVLARLKKLALVIHP
jgi:HK97 family phage prohead protease